MATIRDLSVCDCGRPTTRRRGRVTTTSSLSTHVATHAPRLRPPLCRASAAFVVRAERRLQITRTCAAHLPTRGHSVLASDRLQQSWHVPIEFTSAVHAVDLPETARRKASFQLSSRRWRPRRHWPTTMPMRNARPGNVLAFNHRPTGIKPEWWRSRTITTRAPRDGGAFDRALSVGDCRRRRDTRVASRSSLRRHRVSRCRCPPHPRCSVCGRTRRDRRHAPRAARLCPTFLTVRRRWHSAPAQPPFAVRV